MPLPTHSASIKWITAGLLITAFALAAPSQSAEGDRCPRASFAVQVLGSGGPQFGDQRASSSYLLWHHGKARVLVDMGGGAALRFEQSGAKIEDLSAIAFTHLHADHSADFPVLVKASYFGARKRDLPVFGPEGNKLLPSMTDFTQALFGAAGAWPYLGDLLDDKSRSDFHFKPVTVKTDKENIQLVYEDDADLVLRAITTHHGPLPALAWRVEVGDLSVTFSGDMNGDFETLDKLAHRSSVLVAHNAIPESADGIARQLHMPPSVIGKIANKANVAQLVLSHRMQRTLGVEKETLRLIGTRYKGKVSFADDLDCIVLK